MAGERRRSRCHQCKTMFLPQAGSYAKIEVCHKAIIDKHLFCDMDCAAQWLRSYKARCDACEVMPELQFNKWKNRGGKDYVG